MGSARTMGVAKVREATLKIYPVALVGESHCQAEIECSHDGERVWICHETGNPFDPLALRVESYRGEKLGYIARSSWLRDAIHQQGRGTAATIKSIDGEEGLRGVVINVTLTDDEVGLRHYEPPAAEPPSDAASLLSRPKPKLVEAQAKETRRLLTLLLDMSKVPITCQCGREMSIDLKVLTPELKINCQVCGHRDSLKASEIVRLDREFLVAARELLTGAALPVPSDQEIFELAHINQHRGHKPTTTEHGFLRRIFKRPF